MSIHCDILVGTGPGGGILAYGLLPSWAGLLQLVSREKIALGERGKLMRLVSGDHFCDVELNLVPRWTCAQRAIS
jgi:hypothetical protein